MWPPASRAVGHDLFRPEGRAPGCGAGRGARPDGCPSGRHRDVGPRSITYDGKARPVRNTSSSSRRARFEPTDRLLVQPGPYLPEPVPIRSWRITGTRVNIPLLPRNSEPPASRIADAEDSTGGSVVADPERLYLQCSSPSSANPGRSRDPPDPKGPRSGDCLPSARSLCLGDRV